MVAEDRVLHRLLTSILMPRRMVAALTAVSACARDSTIRRVLVPLCVVLTVMAPTAAIAADRDGDEKSRHHHRLEKSLTPLSAEPGA